MQELGHAPHTICPPKARCVTLRNAVDALYCIRIRFTNEKVLCFKLRYILIGVTSIRRGPYFAYVRAVQESKTRVKKEADADDDDDDGEEAHPDGGSDVDEPMPPADTDDPNKDDNLELSTRKMQIHVESKFSELPRNLKVKDRAT